MRTNMRVVSFRSDSPSVRARRRAGSSWWPVTLGLTGLAGVAAIGATAYLLWPREQKPMLADSCSQIVSVLIDLSDKPSDVVRRRVVERLDRLPADSCKGTLVLVSQFRPVPGEPITLLFERTDPGKSSELPWETKKLVDQRRQSQFTDPLRAQIERALVPEHREQTLLIEGLSHHTRLPILKGHDPEVTKTVVIVSDLLEFSKRCSMYPGEKTKPTAHWPAVKQRCQQLLDDVPIRLKGAEVEILWIKRGRGKNGADLQPPEMQEFYERLFKAAGAKNVIWFPM